MLKLIQITSNTYNWNARLNEVYSFIQSSSFEETLILQYCKQAESMLMQYCNIAIIKNDGSDNPNECRLCKDKAKFGIITIPYVIKLLIFYLQAAGINITFRTKEITYPNNRMIEEQFLV